MCALPIYQHRNVSVAARLLAVPQPTLSRWLGQLRQHFDDPLFVRTRSGMEPTPFEDQLAEPIQDMIAIYRQKVRRSEEHTSELQSLMLISYVVFCLTKIKKKQNIKK